MPDKIETLLREAAGKSNVIAMGGGLPSPRQFPRWALVQALTEAVFQPSPQALQYAWPEGADDLRERAKRLAAAVHRELPGWRFEFPEGGFALWLEPDAPDCRGGGWLDFLLDWAQV